MFKPITTPVLAWIAFAVNIVVILQGAVVRATGSGAGCGRHWPLCNGEVVPVGATFHTLIEFTHRAISGLALLTILTMLIWVMWRERQHRGLVLFAWASFIFVIIEALLGALTVMWELTGDNQSVERGLMVATHLVNSLLLVGSLALSVVYSMVPKEKSPWPLRLSQQGALSAALLIGLLSMLFLMFTGGIAAMGNTMFPSESLQAGLAADFDPTSHPLIRLRILHPVIAITVGIYLLLSLGLSWWMKPNAQSKRYARLLLGIYLLQVVVGFVNLGLLAPMALQLLHLGLAVAAFAMLCVYSVYALGTETGQPVTDIKETTFPSTRSSTTL